MQVNISGMLASGFQQYSSRSDQITRLRVPIDSPRGAQQQAVQASHHEPNGCASAQRPGDLCDARLLRAPQGSRRISGVASSLVTFFWRRRRKLLPPRHERLPRGAATLVTRPSFPALRRRWIVAGCAVIRLPLHCTVCHSIFSISFLLNAFLHRAWRVISWNVSFMENSLRPPVYWRS